MAGWMEMRTAARFSVMTAKTFASGAGRGCEGSGWYLRYKASSTTLETKEGRGEMCGGQWNRRGVSYVICEHTINGRGLGDDGCGCNESKYVRAHF
jgi:hypothetical protein